MADHPFCATALNAWTNRGPDCGDLVCAEDGTLGCTYDVKRDMNDLHSRGILADMQRVCDGRYLCETCADGDPWGANDTYVRNDTAARLPYSECTDWSFYAPLGLTRDCALPSPSFDRDSRIFFLDVETAHPAAIGLWCLQFVWLLACMVTPAGRATFEFVLMGRGRKLGVAWLVSHFAAMALLTAAQLARRRRVSPWAW